MPELQQQVWVLELRANGAHDYQFASAHHTTGGAMSKAQRLALGERLSWTWVDGIKTWEARARGREYKLSQSRIED